MPTVFESFSYYLRIANVLLIWLQVTSKYTHFLAKKRSNLQELMVQKIHIKYIKERLQIGVVNWREVYLLSPQVLSLQVEVDRGTPNLQAERKRPAY